MFGLNLLAQSGKLTGRVTDSVSQQPIEYATIRLIDSASRKIITGTVTDTKGNFLISLKQKGNRLPSPLPIQLTKAPPSFS